MTTVASAVLFRSERKGSGFHANKRPLGGDFYLIFNPIRTWVFTFIPLFVNIGCWN